MAEYIDREEATVWIANALSLIPSCRSSSYKFYNRHDCYTFEGGEYENDN